MTQAILLPEEYLVPMKQGPGWASMESVAHTLAYDGIISRDFMKGTPLPTDRWTSVAIPTVVMTGGNSEPFFHEGAKSLVSLLPNATHQIVEGQDHAVDPAVLGQTITS